MNYRAIFLAVLLSPSMAYALYDLADNPPPNRGDGGKAVMEEWRKRYEQTSREKREREAAEREEQKKKWQEEQAARQEEERVRKEALARKEEVKSKEEEPEFVRVKLLAEHGDAEAQAQLGLMYELGRGTKVDHIEAFKWYMLASKSGVAWAQVNLGLAYFNGRGVDQNDKEAAKWFHKAALSGSTGGQKRLAIMYDQGRGFPQDTKEAASWINQSNSMYIKGLEKDYGKRIHFESVKAERAVRNFNIDCRASDKRFLPLIGILYARLATADREDMWIETTVQERAGEVRIIDSLHSPKAVVHTNVVFQINKWGELQPMGSIRAEAITNACFGSHGPIWLK